MAFKRLGYSLEKNKKESLHEVSGLASHLGVGAADGAILTGVCLWSPGVNARELAVGVVLRPSWGLPRACKCPFRNFPLEFSQRWRGDKNFGG